MSKINLVASLMPPTPVKERRWTTLKIHPKPSKNYPQMASKGVFRGHLGHLGRPLDTGRISGPSWTSFLAILAPPWPPMGDPFGGLWLLVPVLGAPRTKNGRVWGSLLSVSFFKRFLVLFWVGLGRQKLRFGLKGVSKIKVSAKSFF